MKIIPRLAVAGVAVLAAYAPLAPAGAEDCKPPYCNPHVPTDSGAVLGNEQEKPAVQPASEEQPAEAARNDSAPSGELAFTGGDVLGMTVIGAGALGVGTILVRRSKAAKQNA